MNRRSLGLVLMAVGAVAVALAIVIAISGSPEDEPVAAPTTTKSGAPMSTLVATTSTKAATTTSRVDATTSSSPATTPTTQPAETVADFVDSFSAALATGDIEFVMSRLHPDVVSAYTQEACQTWVSSEIMALSDYRLIGDLSGPVEKTVTIGGQQVTIPNVYSAQVGFDFGGQAFESSADFALVDGVVYWLGICE